MPSPLWDRSGGSDRPSKSTSRIPTAYEKPWGCGWWPTGTWATAHPPVRVIVDINPVSHTATASRGLLHGTATAGDLGLVAVSIAALLVVFGPLTMHLDNKKKNT